MNALKRYTLNKAYLARVALRDMIETELAPKLAEKRKADDLLERCTEAQYGREKQGYSCLVGDKYQGAEYRTTDNDETDLACENDSRFALIKESAKIAEAQRNDLLAYAGE